jgi:phenylpropionate dioxygenase-like ring-hydroxylating dioxygenase large terminal subunit
MAGTRHVPFAVTDPERILAQRYYDKEFFELECQHVWPHVWQMACRTEQVPHVGDWIEYSNLGSSVIVVRTSEGIRAFHNACRHRGVELAKGSGNCKAKGFICPFHGWRWNMDGKNTFVYGRHLFSERQLAQDDLALKPCRAELLAGCVFINFDETALPLRECLGPLAKSLDAYRTDRMCAEWCVATVLPANWKIAMEAFMEGYHTMRTHPQLHGALPTFFNSTYGADTGGIGKASISGLSGRDRIKAQFGLMQLLSVGMGGMCHAKDVAVAETMLDVELPEDPDQALATWFGMLNDAVTKAGRARGEPTPDLNEIAAKTPMNAVEFIFPHYFLLPNLSSMSAYRIRPLSPETCLFELWSLTHFPEGKEPKPVMVPTLLPCDSDKFPPIPQQDYANIPAQQRGLHAVGFEFMRLAKSVEGLISNFHRLVDGYIGGTPIPRLGKAMTALSSNFEGPIHDLDL